MVAPYRWGKIFQDAQWMPETVDSSDCVFSNMPYLWQSLFCKLGTIREYLNCQHYSFCTLGLLNINTSIFWQLITQMATKWPARKIPGQRDDSFPGGTEQDGAGVHCATQNGAQFKIKILYTVYFRVFHLMFCDSCWLRVTETVDGVLLWWRKKGYVWWVLIDNVTANW